MTFNQLLDNYRNIAYSERDKGDRFERLMQVYLLTDPKYAFLFKNVWLWNEFPGRNDLGGTDTGIDLVALTLEGDYWAIQCKCYQEGTTIDKPAVDSFLSTSSREFKNEQMQTTRFAQRLWIDTSGRSWGKNAEEAIRNQNPPVIRLRLFDLMEAPVNWEKLEKGIHGEAARTPKKSLRAHQKEAMDKTHDHYKTADRGKLIMACGTGKTFTALRIAEHETNGRGLVLFLVPSIALLGQSLREWCADANEPLNAICICSDPEITKKRTKNEDTDSFSVVDLALPASTNITEIIHQFQSLSPALSKGEGAGMTVVFSTYQSIEVISRVQKELAKLPPFGGIEGGFIFDLIICDEAHRTTGVSLAGEDESAFTRVHDASFIRSKKRLYMTATPRLYNDETKSKAAQAEAVLCSMDDPTLYGEEMYRIGFGEAVEKGLLTDYKVLILTLSDKDVPPAVQRMISDGDTEIHTDDLSKLIGTVNALSKQFVGDLGVTKESYPELMRRAVAFCANIITSKKIAGSYNNATEAYLGSLTPEKKEQMVSIEARHIDGTMAAPERDQLLAWLKADTTDNECRVVTNVRVLSEGVDVPSLDAVLFLSARNSQVDVVQSVGRVMRKSPGKKYGYIIIPVIVPADVEADKALDDNERYKVVWTVLNALRAHDDRFNATVNKIELNRSKPMNILVGRPDYTFDDEGNPLVLNDEAGTYQTNQNINQQLAIQFEQLQNVVFARMVQKVGDRRYWEQWAKDVAVIAERQIERITYLIQNKHDQRVAFDAFLLGLQKNINPSISEAQAVEMLAQHIITQPIFDALFEGYSFIKSNAVSVSMQHMIDALESGSNLAEQDETLQKFYESVRRRAEGIDNAEGKQRIIIELYDKFFKAAFPKMVEQLGIVYTPVEVVDFIIHSVNDVLKQEFGRSLTDENIHILDPFTGTGTFITRLLQSGLIEEKDLERKYKYELHANELVLLAYYIAAVNIENAYHDLVEGFRGQGIGFREQSSGFKDKYENKRIDYDSNQLIQGTNSMAGSHEFGGDNLFAYPNIPERGDLWVDQSGQEGGSIDTGEHSRGLREEKQEGIPSVSFDSQRFAHGIGNTYDDSVQDSFSRSGSIHKNQSATSNCGKNIERITQIADPQTLTPLPFTPYEGIVLTDTFQLGETDGADKLFSDMFPRNSERVARQKNAPLRVIMGNPPYSVGQKSANDNAQNQKYERLDARIADTYAKATDATNKNSLYDSYIKAFRWSTDRLDSEHGGIIAFVSNGAWLDGNSADGFRLTLEKEFDKIYVFNLRGNARTQGELRQKEAGNVFGSGSRTPIAITLLVKNPKATSLVEKKQSETKATIHYHDIGDYLSREDKLSMVKKFKTVANDQMAWTTLAPNEHGDWISQRNDAFGSFIPMGDKDDKSNKATFFIPFYSNGLKTQRDAWCYNSSIGLLRKNIQTHIDFYNEQREAFSNAGIAKKIDIKSFVERDTTKISWTRALEWDAEKNKIYSIEDGQFVTSYYRPFFKQHLYFARSLNEMVYQIPKLFPNPSLKNLVICVSASYKDGSVLISDSIPDLHFNGDTQAFPLYFYEERPKSSPTLFDVASEEEYVRRDGVSDFIWERAKKQYSAKNITKEDIFYYVYGFLHCPSYRETFANDLKKMLPRLPLVEDVRDFWSFSNAGRKLAELHINYEKVAPYDAIIVTGAEKLSFIDTEPADTKLYLVEKMRFPKKGQKDTIIYNSRITIENIPEKAYEYVVNGKSAIEWIMERYQITNHKESGIRNDPNDWSAEVGNPRYILDLLLSIINVSVQTVDIVEGLPEVKFE